MVKFLDNNMFYNRSYTMKLKGLWLLTAILVWPCFSINVSAQSLIRRLESDQFEIVLEELDSDSIKILQVTDLHLGSRGHWKDDLNTFHRIKRLGKIYW